MNLANKMIGLLLLLSASAGANADLVDPIMGAEFLRHVQCSVQSTQEGGHPRTAAILILGEYIDIHRKMVALVAADEDFPRFAARVSQLPDLGQPNYQADAYVEDDNFHQEYVTAHISLDPISGTGNLVSTVQPYMLGSFKLSNCRILH